MRFYRATSGLFPRNYEFRLMAVCFGAVHVPLVVYAAVQAARGHWDWSVFTLLLVSTLLGTAFGLAAIYALLAPVREATLLLRSIQNGEQVAFVPVGGSDLVGRLLQGVAVAANEAAERVARLSHEAERDLLTGLRNRRGFLAAAEPALQGTQTCVLALIDLDHFKVFNDSFGHDEGDALLTRFAERLASGVRRDDVAARWGGEEFAVLFPGAALDEARQVIERLRVELSERDPLEIGGKRLTFSCGLSVLRRMGDLREATRSADTALYEAKQNGRNQVATAR